MQTRNNLIRKIQVLRELKEECESVWQDVKAEGSDSSPDPSIRRSAKQTYDWYISICEILEMYEDILKHF